MSGKTPEQDQNEQLIRRLYHLAEAASKDTPKFVSLFADGGYFYDVAGEKNTMALTLARRSTSMPPPFPICTENSIASIFMTMSSSWNYR
jgi:hypothetical protein